MYHFIVIKVFIKKISTQEEMNQNPAFLWAIGYNINAELVKKMKKVCKSSTTN